MGKQGLILGGIILAVVALASACQPDKEDSVAFECKDALGCVTIASGDPILIASLQDLTGGAAPIGLTQDRSLRLALAERNNQLLGHPVVVQSEDTGCTYEGGANAALRVVANPQIVGALGTACSGAASGALPIISEAGWVMISGANTAPALTSEGGVQGAEWYPGYFRAIYNGDDLARAAVQFAVTGLGLKRAATVNDGDLYSQGVARSFERAFTQLGGTITLSMTINKGDEDMGPALHALADSAPDLIYAPVFQPEGDYLVAQAGEEFSLDKIVFVGTESLLVDGFIRQLDPSLSMYFTTATLFEEDKIVQLVERYREVYSEYPHTTLRYAYDAASLFVYAIEAAAIQDPDGTLHIGRQAVRDALYGVRDFEGITGPLSCDTFGDCNRATFYIVRVTNPSEGLAGVLSNVVASYQFD